MEVSAVIRYEWVRVISVFSPMNAYKPCMAVMSRQRVGRWCYMLRSGSRTMDDKCRNGHPIPPHPRMKTKMAHLNFIKSLILGI
ncbi:hypothetical protein TNCV_3378041 [Trichonephila clavipes]|nr:hypothetical protein TNCV_3378041 [Trichonephila clavipes]